MDASARITTICSDLFDRLDVAGPGDFKVKNSRQITRMRLERVPPPAFRSVTEERFLLSRGSKKMYVCSFNGLGQMHGLVKPSGNKGDIASAKL